MKVNIKSLLKDKNVLYVIVFIATINLLGFLMIQDLNAVLFMFIVGFLTSYFSKNMIIVLLTALIATNLFATSRSLYVKSEKEGFSKKQKRKFKKKSSLKNTNIKQLKLKKGEDEETFESIETMSSENKSNRKRKPKLDYAATLEEAYDGLEGLLGSSAINSMSKDTQRLADKQQKLMKNIENLEPMMQRAGKMLEGLQSSKIGGMLNTLEKSMGKLSGLKNRANEMN